MSIRLLPNLVIASAAKQSRASLTAALDCFVATLLAMTRVWAGVVVAAAPLLTTPAIAQAPPPFTLEHRMLLRCSAAFAIVAAGQQRGLASARAYPPLGERGREYFVRASVRLMDDLALTREQVEASLRSEVETLQKASSEAADPAQYVDDLMQPCLSALDASGL